LCKSITVNAGNTMSGLSICKSPAGNYWSSPMDFAALFSWTSTNHQSVAWAYVTNKFGSANF
jgi:hypothetical protein